LVQRRAFTGVVILGLSSVRAVSLASPSMRLAR
jgi:hypothetical protein